MPTKYKAVSNHDRLDLEIELNEIDRQVKDRWPAIQKLLHLEYDDRDRLLADIVMELTRFVLKCDALPLRTRNMMLATAIEIKRNPLRFLELSERYDPEVNARVLDAAAKLSDTTNSDIQRFELGLGNGPPPAEIERAANNVIKFLKTAGPRLVGPISDFRRT